MDMKCDNKAQKLHTGCRKKDLELIEDKELLRADLEIKCVI